MLLSIMVCLVVQWLRLCASTAGIVCLMPGRGLRSCMPSGTAKKKKKIPAREC